MRRFSVASPVVSVRHAKVKKYARRQLRAKTEMQKRIAERRRAAQTWLRSRGSEQ